MNVTVDMPLQLSVATILPGTGAGTRLAHCTVEFAGHVMDGGVLSNTVIVCVQLAVFPQASVAL